MRSIRRPLASLALLFAVEGTAAKEPMIRRLDGSTIPVAKAEAFARQTLAEAHVTGAQIAVVQNGQIVWSAAFGRRRLTPELPMERGTVTWAASITKPVFATYVMQLVERQEFALDTPIARLLPQPLDQYDAYKESATELVRDPRWAAVTPRMLLSHTSGLANFAFVEPDKKLRLHFMPGTQWRYSGEGMNIVQFAIEQMKKRPLDQLMQEALFTPLGMRQTGMIYRTEFAENVSDRFGVNEQFLAQTKRYPARAAGNMMSSAEDLARFANALMAGQIVKLATLAEMLKPVKEIRSLHQFAVKLNEGEGTEAAAVGLAYGVGWGLLTKTKFGPAFFKEGHGDGAQNYMICFPQRRACMVLLTNSDNGELAFRSLLETILGDTVTPWEWEGYTPEYIMESRKHQ